MKNIRIFVSENFQFLEVKVSIYLNRRVFIMFGEVLGDVLRPPYGTYTSCSKVQYKSNRLPLEQRTHKTTCPLPPSIASTTDP